MHFDDRLATVLRHRADGERAAHTQFRQLLDLLGNSTSGCDDSLLAAARLRLAALGETIPPHARAAMIRETGLRFRNPELVQHLAQDEPEVAAAVLAVAQLSSEDWDVVVPRLPLHARGFLRERSDLPAATLALLEGSSVDDSGMPPASHSELQATLIESGQASASPVPANDFDDRASHREDRDNSEIGELVRRIEAFRKRRAEQTSADDAKPTSVTSDRSSAPLTGFAFTTDARGRVDWADADTAPMVVGKVLALPPADAGEHPRLRGLTIEWDGAPAITGAWVVDAAPRFDELGGRYIGYAGRFRRPAQPDRTPSADSAADRMRQLLHELKTPVNAIQGFAEVIQQQLFGPTPHEYRAIAAAIAGDAARILAGFDQLDRLAKLEGGALTLQPGQADWGAIVARLAARFDPALQPSSSGISLEMAGASHRVPLDPLEAETLGWRLLATLAGAAGTGERIELSLTEAEDVITMSATLPAALAQQEDVFAAAATAPSEAPVSAGIFGSGFALRLARAEANAAGGSLERQEDSLVLTLPRLTAASAASGQSSTSSAG